MLGFSSAGPEARFGSIILPGRAGPASRLKWALCPFFVFGFRVRVLKRPQQVNEQLVALIEPVVEGLGFTLWGVEYFAQGKSASLKVYIESEAGVGVDDCANVSRQLSAVLDVEDPIVSRYTLEVSSPGMDRRLFTLAQFKAFAGSNVRLSLKDPYEGRRRYKGLLCGIEEDDVVVRSGDEEYLFPIDQIERANVIPSYDRTKAEEV